MLAQSFYFIGFIREGDKLRNDLLFQLNYDSRRIMDEGVSCLLSWIAGIEFLCSPSILVFDQSVNHNMLRDCR